MFLKPKLSKSQYKFFASFLKTLAEGIVLGSAVAFFLPETLQMKQAISLGRYFSFTSLGLLLLFFGVILERRGEKGK
jgi:hypothetical protein